MTMMNKMARFKSWLVFGYVLAWVATAAAYKPVMFMHGIIASGDEADGLFHWIQQSHPGTVTYSVDMFDKEKSVVTNMNDQVAKVQTNMQAFMSKHPEGVHLICFSQGGLICRGMLENVAHNVDTFISVSSPQSGQFGDTSYVKDFLPVFLRDEVYRFCYTGEGQKKVSVCNYWNDPYHQPMYRNVSRFLPVLNNETYNAKSKEFKTNFLRLKQLVMIGGPDDGVITPWQSSHFGFYDDKLNVVEMKDQKWYKEDWFGLQTLDKRGAITTHIMPNVQHTHWLKTYAVFQKFILPYLT